MSVLLPSHFRVLPKIEGWVGLESTVPNGTGVSFDARIQPPSHSKPIKKIVYIHSHVPANLKSVDGVGVLWNIVLLK